MFQYVWYDEKKFQHLNEVDLPPQAIDFGDIQSISSIYWAEHCTECAVPYCYNNCANWEAREDRKCRRFVYGIKRTPSERSYRATLKLKRWGKIESRYFNRLQTPGQCRRTDRINYDFSNVIRGISRLLKPVSPTMKLNGALEFYKGKLFERAGTAGALNTFLVSCCLHEQTGCTLYLEMYNPGQVFMRNTIRLEPGYNQIAIPLDPYEAHIEKETRVRIFGSEETECEITFFFLDFVELKESGKLKLLPAGKRPADKVKCVVWDLDHTVWDGILIESDEDHLQLKPGVLETMKWLDQRGIIQCVCSKNEESMAEKVLQRLEIDQYFVYKFINWMPKSLNIDAMAKLLNINVDTFAFIDDSEHERAEVAKHLPCVRVFKETDLPAFPSLEPFDVPITEDSVNRRKMYQMNRVRNDYQQQNALDQITFLRQCGLEADVSQIQTPEQRRRSYELLMRTNQLNLSGKKYREDEFDALVDERGDQMFILTLKDRFGSYGQSMVLLMDETADTIFIREFALSCRIAGKYVESAILRWLSAQHGDKQICLVGKNTKKNGLLVQTLTEIGFDPQPSSDPEALILVHDTGAAYQHCEIVQINDLTGGTPALQ